MRTLRSIQFLPFSIRPISFGVSWTPIPCLGPAAGLNRGTHEDDALAAGVFRLPKASIHRRPFDFQDIFLTRRSCGIRAHAAQAGLPWTNDFSGSSTSSVACCSIFAWGQVKRCKHRRCMLLCSVGTARSDLNVCRLPAYIHVHVCMHVHMYIQLNIWMHIYIYIYIYFIFMYIIYI